MEYTLEDALESLKDIQLERRNEIKDTVNAISNNEVNALNETSTLEDITKKQHKLAHCLLRNVQQENPKDYPLPKTSDLYRDAIKTLEEEIGSNEKLLERLKKNLSEIEENISFLEQTQIGLDNMREAYLDVAQNVTKENYDDEYKMTKRIFLKVKRDLYDVVNTIFPENERFKNLLAELSSAYMKGGDDMYVNFASESLDDVKFLIEADIVMYHRNDKTKIRMTDLL